MDFPQLRHIDDVLPAIEGFPEFVVADRGTHRIINYNVMKADTFHPTSPDLEQRYNAAIRRECRGIMFDAEGNIIRRPLHKFFNVNECEETQVHNLRFDEHHVIYEKLDGSMIAPFRIEGQDWWGTKMGVTDVAKPVNEWVSYHPNYMKFADYCISNGHTPIFEWCSPQNRIVIGHQKDQLILLAIRHMATGVYHGDFRALADQAGIPVVQQFEAWQDINAFIEHTRALENKEGYVTCWEDGYRIKLKSDWYCQIHKAKDQITNERHVFTMIIDNTIDDVLSFLPPEDHKMITDYRDQAINAVENWLIDVNDILSDVMCVFARDRKAFALSDYGKTIPSIVKPIVFKYFDGYDGEQTIAFSWDIIRKHLHSNQRFAELKAAVFPDVKYVL